MSSGTQIRLHPAEALPIIAYLFLLLYLGFRKRNRTSSEEDFIVGSRTLTLPAFVATLVTTWYGGILGVGEFTYLYGLSNWIVFGVPYYVFALLFAIFLAPKIRAAKLLSIPDQFFRNHGKTAGFLSAFYTFFMTLPAPYILMVGFLLQLITGWSLLISLLIGTLFSMIYVLSGGFRAVVRTDILQFTLMFGGFILVVSLLIVNFGGYQFLRSNLPPLHLSWNGGNSFSYILTWFFIASWTFIDPGFHQRCYAAKSQKVARNGILISVGFWAIFDFLTTTTGLYARALLSDINPILSYPLLSHQLLPAFLSGLFLTGLLATIMSTIDSYTLLSAITIGHDFLKRLGSRRQPVTLLRLGLLITAILSIFVAYAIPSVIQIWFLMGSLFIPPLLLPLLGCYFSFFSMNRFSTILNLVAAFATATFHLIFSALQSASLTDIQFLWNLPPLYPGLAVSFLVFLIYKFFIFSTRSPGISRK